jgi:hypothetical protein
MFKGIVFSAKRNGFSQTFLYCSDCSLSETVGLLASGAAQSYGCATFFHHMAPKFGGKNRVSVGNDFPRHATALVAHNVFEKLFCA